MELHQKIKWLRENAGLKQRDLAELLQTSQQYYSEYENGKRKFPLEHLVTLCRHFGVSADYLLGLPDNLHYPKKR
jgi:transcriptional regulator with XRE-family HTH domain